VCAGVTACVAIPWRPAPDRLAAYRRIRHFWANAGYPVVTADSDPSLPFNRSQARNNAVLTAEAEVVVVADADTLCEPRVVAEAVAGVGGEVVYPHDQYCPVAADLTEASWGDLLAAPRAFYLRDDGWEGDWQGEWTIWPGGIIVARSETYWRLGGFDERFTGWGGEDNAFILAATTLTGISRLPGVAVAFDHSVEGVPRRVPAALSSGQLEGVYVRAGGNPDTMQRLVADPARGHPCTPATLAAWKARWTA
jgi:hypothetical protein